MRNRSSLISLGLAAVLGLGCGASQPKSVSPGAATPTSSGVEAVAEPARIVAGEEAPPPEPIGPASFSVRTTVGGKAAAAHVKVLAESGDVVAEAESGAVLELQSGSYRVAVQITDPKTLVDQPTQVRELELSPGKNPELALDFPWAKVQLNVIVNGKSDPNAIVKLSRKGQVVAEMKSGAEFVPVSPGRYEAEVTVKGSLIKLQGILFPEGATQTVPVAVQL